jgi:nicotinamidase-related amidase
VAGERLRDCLLAVDLFSEFDHEDGGALLRSLRERRSGFEDALAQARARGIPVVYANDTYGVWDGDMRALVGRALAGPGGEVLGALEPRDGEAFIVKPRYSAFDLTPLSLVLADLEVERLLLAGMATEMCVAQTAIDARERGLKVTVLTGACATVDEQNEATALEYLEAITGSRLAPTLAEALADQGDD